MRTGGRATGDPDGQAVPRQGVGDRPSERAVAEAWRILRSGGRLVILDLAKHRFEEARELYADECHLCYEVRAALRAAGRHPAVVAPGQCYGEDGAG